MKPLHTLTAADGFTCENGAVRLVDGISQYEGRVEVCNNNKYTTICDDGTWGVEEATVVCQQLNFTEPAESGTLGMVCL